MNLEELKKNPRTQYYAQELERVLQQQQETEAMIATDPDLAEVVAEELETLRQTQQTIESQIQEILDKEKEEEEFPNEIVLEVRAGAGGDEASIFARDLAEMYERYAEKMGWSWKTIDISDNDLGGYKDASFEIKGLDSYKLFQYETGSHRVQRIPCNRKTRTHSYINRNGCYHANP
jgi:peptide chain release factor 1